MIEPQQSFNMPANCRLDVGKNLLRALVRLDVHLKAAVEKARASYQSDLTSASYPGLQITEAELRRIFASEPGSALFRSADADSQEFVAQMGAGIPGLDWLARTFGLSDFDLDLMLLALAPEIDLRYERLFAYLQDDVTKRRPTLDLALNLFCPSAESKLAARNRVAADAPLLRQHLLYLIPDPNHVQPPLLSHYLKLDDQIVRFVLGEESLDTRLSTFCQSTEIPDLLSEAVPELDAVELLTFLDSQVPKATLPLRLYFQGPGRIRQRLGAETIARKVGMRLLIVALPRMPENSRDFQRAFELVVREAWLQRAVLYLENVDALRREDRSASLNSFLELLTRHAGIAIFSGTQPWIPAPNATMGVVTLNFDVLDSARARECWREHIATAGLIARAEDLEILADRFRLTPEQISDATICAASSVRWRAAGQQLDSRRNVPSQMPITLEQLCTAARAESGHDLNRLAQKIKARNNFEDIVLPPEPLQQLREVCSQAMYWQRVFGDWGFDRKLSLGKGLNILFSGPPGTGKTMAAEVLANELQLDAYKIDLSQVVSKYIGETEKNLDRIFAAAEHSNAILFFDEADALFGKRSEVKDSHDRYANIEIGYLLQKMEEYQGVAILATNVRNHIDEAFVRRMQVIVEFPFPGEQERRRVWQVIFPRETPMGNDVDFTTLAREVALAGGNIRNIALAAAFYAAADGETVHMAHLLKASRREYQKLGRTWNERRSSNGRTIAASAQPDGSAV